jgi:hypothetical protein
MTTAAPPAARTGSHGQESSTVSPSAADIRRRWRVPLAIIALILIGGTVVALLQPAPAAQGYLDPASAGAAGTHALADILAQRGEQVIRTATPAAAQAAASSGGATPAAAQAAASSGGATLVITSPEYLTQGQLSTLASVPGNLVIVEPDAAGLATLAPGVTLAGPAHIGPVQPRCRLTAAQLAGTADMGGLSLRLQPGISGAAQCYPVGGSPSLVRYSAGGKVITILGTGTPLTNGYLDQLGNAALALNLLGGSQRIVWLVPTPATPAGAGAAGGQKSLISLIPLGLYLVALQLGIAVLLAALWRARRLGPLVPEQLPVVVRASETAEGHARLYQSRRARGRAAAALRTAMLNRLIPAVGLPYGALPAAVTAALAARSGLGAAKIETMLFGPAPGSDAALVTLADDLDALEREVRAQ